MHGSCTVRDRKTLRLAITSTQNITGTHQGVSGIGVGRCLHSLLTLLPSGERYRSIRCCKVHKVHFHNKMYQDSNIVLCCFFNYYTSPCLQYIYFLFIYLFIYFYL